MNLAVEELYIMLIFGMVIAMPLAKVIFDPVWRIKMRKRIGKPGKAKKNLGFAHIVLPGNNEIVLVKDFNDFFLRWSDGVYTIIGNHIGKIGNTTDKKRFKRDSFEINERHIYQIDGIPHIRFWYADMRPLEYAIPNKQEGTYDPQQLNAIQQRYLENAKLEALKFSSPKIKKWVTILAIIIIISLIIGAVGVWQINELGEIAAGMNGKLDTIVDLVTKQSVAQGLVPAG